MKIIDLSVYYEVNKNAEPFLPEIEYTEHAEMAKIFSEKLSVPISAFPGEILLAHEYLKGISHVGTHVDAPSHFGPFSEGRKARSIDEVPLEWCYGNGVLLDIRPVEKLHLISVDDLEKSLKKIKYQVQPRDIILIQTGWDKYINQPEYLSEQPGMSREAVLWLLNQGVVMIGIDTYGFDRPFQVMAEEYKAGNKDAMFPAHMVGREKEYCHIEKLGNLDAIPFPYGFKVAAFPMKLKGGTAGYARVVAIIED